MLISRPFIIVTLLVGLTLCQWAPARADFVKDREAAIKLYWADKNQDAMAAFMKLASEATAELQKSDALDWASRTALRMRQPDQAMDLASQIPTDSMKRTAQARVLAPQRQWARVLELLPAADLATWPVTVSGEAYLLRGRAAMGAEDAAAAAEAYARAFELATEHNAKAGALLGLGSARRALNEPDAAVEAFDKVFTESNNVARHADAAIASAQIRMDQGKPEQAVQQLDKVDLAKLKVVSLFVDVQMARGKALAQKGDKAPAVEAYKKIVEHAGASDAQKQAAQKAINALTATGS